MKKIISCFLVLMLFGSCKNLLFNSALSRLGAFDDSIELVKLKNEAKEVIIIPMIHVATEAQYDDVRRKVDSLNKLGYYFYYERVRTTSNDTAITMRKFRKITKVPIPASGYMFIIDSVIGKKFKIKLKKKIIGQPLYSSLGVDSINGRNVDVTISELVNFYEFKYKPISLEPCDLNTSIYLESGCNEDNSYPQMRKEVIVNFRNERVLQELSNEKRNKIAIIYGKGHLKGLKAGLLKMGYK